MDTPVTPEKDSKSEEVMVPEEPVILNEVVEKETYGKYTGNTKWFNDKLGYGFVTICDGDQKGKDIFVHHSGINPLNSNYKTLRKGEYIQFNIITGKNGLQAVDVTGIKGGPLMCDSITSKRNPGSPTYIKNVEQDDAHIWQNIPRKPRTSVPPHLTVKVPRKYINPNGIISVPNARPYKNVAKYNNAKPRVSPPINVPVTVA